MRKAQKVATVIAALLAAAGVGIASINSLPRESATTARPLTGPEVFALMLRSGLQAESLAALGATPADAQTVAQQFAVYLNSSPDAVQQMRDGLLAARSERSAAIRAARDTVGRVASAREAPAPAVAASAASNLESAFDEARAFATSNFTAAQRQNLRDLRDLAHWEVPAYTKLTQRTEAQWVALRDAYTARAAAQTRGARVHPAVLALIDQAESDPAARAAKSNIQANAAAIEEVLRTFSR